MKERQIDIAGILGIHAITSDFAAFIVTEKGTFVYPETKNNIVKI